MAVTPLDAATACMDRADTLLAQGGVAGLAALRADDLARQGLVLAVAAVDAYFHMRVLRSVQSRKKLRGAIEKVKVEFADVVSVTNKLREAQARAERANDETKKKAKKKKAKKKKKAERERKSAPRPWVVLKRLLREKLLTVTFQSPRGVESALSMVGVRKPWTKLVTVGIAANGDEIKERLSSIVHRRNQIVHEGDMRRMDRPQQVVLNDVDHAAIGSDLAWLRSFVAAVDTI